MIIRKAEETDFKQVLDLQLELEKTECKFDSNLVEGCYDTNEGKRRLKNRIMDKNQIFLVAQSDDEIIGFIDGRIMDEAIWYKEKVGILEHICVGKEYRKKGIAMLLLKKFEEEIKKMGAKYIQILAFPNNNPAIDLYKKYGYKEYSVYYSKKI